LFKPVPIAIIFACPLQFAHDEQTYGMFVVGIDDGDVIDLIVES